MTRRIPVLVSIAVLALIAGGCPRPTPVELTDAQKAAIQLMAEQTKAAAAALHLLHPLRDSRLDLDDIAQIGAFGTCPLVSFVSTQDQAAMQFNYGLAGIGCTTGAMANQTVTGTVDVTVNRAARTTTVNINLVTIAGAAVTGQVVLTIADLVGGVSLDGTADLTTAGVGSFVGDITAWLERTGLLRLPTADVDVTDGTATLAVAFSSLVIDPVNNGNFIPESGTAQFTVTETGGSPAATLLVTFTSQSPVTGTVRVQVNGGTATNYQVPGLTGN